MAGVKRRSMAKICLALGLFILAGVFRQLDRSAPPLPSAVFFLLTNLIGRPDFISYKLADAGNPSVWLNHYLYRIPMAVWTLRNQKAYKTARNKYDMYIFEGFSVK